VKSEEIFYQKITFTGSTNINFIRYFPLFRNSTASTPRQVANNMLAKISGTGEKTTVT
jgi:hypothetical protein